MAYLPSDPVMLLSYVNMKLRDEYASFSDLCEDMEVDEEALAAKLVAAGFTYDEEDDQWK